MAMSEQIIIDVEPSDLVVDGRRRFVSETDKSGVFTRRTLIYGLKGALNFIGWCLKETIKLIAEGARMVIDGNKEMNDELRRNRPRYVSKRPAFYIPTREEEEMEKGVSIRAAGVQRKSF